MRSHIKGFSLVELMVAMTIGLIISVALAGLFVNSSANRSELERNTRQIENGRYAMNLLEQEIAHAGYFGRQGMLEPPAAIPNPCSTSLADIRNGMRVPIQGFVGDTASPLACLANYKANTDVLVLRRADTIPTAVADLDPNKYYIQTNVLDTPILARGNAGANFTLTNRDGTLAEIREYHQNIFYISCSGGCDASDEIPSMRRVDVSAVGTEIVNVVDGIEHMKVEYGVDDPIPDCVPGAAQDGVYGAPKVYEADPTAAQWPNVVALKVHLLARNIELSPGHDDSNKIYKLGSYYVPAEELDKRYKRNAFTAVVRAVNQSQRREGLKCR